MSTMADKLFSEWLADRMKENGWSQSDFARAAGIKRGVINKSVNQKSKKPDADTCVAIARALKMSPITVFRAAKLLPEEPARIPELEDFKSVLEKISPDGRKELLEFARLKLVMEEKRNETAQGFSRRKFIF